MSFVRKITTMGFERARVDEADVAGDTTSTAGFTMYTPSSASTVVDDAPSDLRSAVPWPGSTYMILEKGSGRAITRTNDELSLKKIGEGGNNRWLCVENRNYFSFHDPKSGTYMGHDRKSAICSKVMCARGWECFVPRQHPDGGYQLLVPFWSDALMIVVVADDGVSLVRREHGTTLWNFVRV